jgi:hypothetical protein
MPHIEEHNMSFVTESLHWNLELANPQMLPICPITEVKGETVQKSEPSKNHYLSAVSGKSLTLPRINERSFASVEGAMNEL